MLSKYSKLAEPIVQCPSIVIHHLSTSLLTMLPSNNITVVTYQLAIVIQSPAIVQTFVCFGFQDKYYFGTWFQGYYSRFSHLMQMRFDESSTAQQNVAVHCSTQQSVFVYFSPELMYSNIGNPKTDVFIKVWKLKNDLQNCLLNCN